MTKIETGSPPRAARAALFAAEAWTDAIDMTGAQVAVAAYCPDWWSTKTRLLIRRVRLDVDAGQVSPDARSRRRRTLHPDQRALPG